MTKNPSGPWAFKYRGAIWTVFILIMLLVAKPTAKRIAFGLPLVVIGQLYRFWAVGCIRRYRGEVAGAQQLVSWGPYALSRNPLYLANGLMGLGWAITSCGYWLILPFVILFYLLYIKTIIPHEESVLSGLFGEDYTAYQREVPAFWPKLSRWQEAKGPYDWSVLRKSEIHSVLVTVVVTVLILLKGW